MKSPSTLRATAAFVAGVLLASAIAVGAAGRCCPDKRSAETVLRSFDCCAAMLASPISRPLAIRPPSDDPASIQGDASIALPSVPPVFDLRAPRAAPRLSVAARAAGPPLYRLNAQLLI